MSHFIQSLFSPSDEQMMWRVKLQDDPQAFASLVGRWQKPIQRLCCRMIGDPHRAEDLTQMTFSRVFLRRADWRESGRFSTFVWQIARNLCLDELRRTRCRREDPLGLSEGDEDQPAKLMSADPAPDAQVEARERDGLVRDALSKLAPHYREVVVFRHYEGLKFREIAEIMGIPEGTVKSRMAEALSQLHRLLNHLKLNENPSCTHEPIKNPIAGMPTL